MIFEFGIRPKSAPILASLSSFNTQQTSLKSIGILKPKELQKQTEQFLHNIPKLFTAIFLKQQVFSECAVFIPKQFQKRSNLSLQVMSLRLWLLSFIYKLKKIIPPQKCNQAQFFCKEKSMNPTTSKLVKYQQLLCPY